MSRIGRTANSPHVQALSMSVDGSAETDPVEPEVSFEDELKELLSPNRQKMVHEDDLFAGLVQQQLRSKFGEEAQERFLERYNEVLGTARGSRIMGEEYAANRALKFVRVQGLISRDEAHLIRNQAFGAAQLDDNPYRLFDASGEAQAVADIDAAVTQASAALSSYESGGAEALSGPQRRLLLKQLRSELRGGTDESPTGELEEPAAEEQPGLAELALSSTKDSALRLQTSALELLLQSRARTEDTST